MSCFSCPDVCLKHTSTIKRQVDRDGPDWALFSVSVLFQLLSTMMDTATPAHAEVLIQPANARLVPSAASPQRHPSNRKPRRNEPAVRKPESLTVRVSSGEGRWEGERRECLNLRKQRSAGAFFSLLCVQTPWRGEVLAFPRLLSHGWQKDPVWNLSRQVKECWQHPVSRSMFTFCLFAEWGHEHLFLSPSSHQFVLHFS